jgi:hypothetical protein
VASAKLQKKEFGRNMMPSVKSHGTASAGVEVAPPGKLRADECRQRRRSQTAGRFLLRHAG